MSLIVSKIAQAIFDNTLGKWLGSLSDSAKCKIGFVAWVLFVVALFWFPQSPTTDNPLYWNENKNPFVKDEGWAFAKVVFPLIWGFFGVKKCLHTERFPLMMTLLFALLVAAALVYALATSGWF